MVPETRATLIQEIALPLVSSTVKVLRPQNVGLPKEVYHESEASVMSCVTELPSSTVMAETVGEFKVAVLQGLLSVTVKTYPFSLVLEVSSTVEVTVNYVEVAWRETSVVRTLMTRPVMEIQDGVGVIVRVSVKVQSVPWVQAGTVHWYGPPPIE